LVFSTLTCAAQRLSASSAAAGIAGVEFSVLKAFPSSWNTPSSCTASAFVIANAASAAPANSGTRSKRRLRVRSFAPSIIHLHH
jgi:hypothetical protein